jgi:hypothetical protein
MVLTVVFSSVEVTRPNEAFLARAELDAYEFNILLAS